MHYPNKYELKKNKKKDKEYTNSIDMWSLGVIAYWLCEGADKYDDEFLHI